MIKRTSFVLGLLLVLGACASPASVDTASVAAETPAVTTAVPVAPAATTAPSENTAPVDTAAPMTPVPDGPPAPDFTLALGDGRSFTLSEESKPVYLVFWAEW